VAARALRPQQLAPDLELPSVIVEVATDARMLVERLIEGDELVVQQLRDMGEVGVAALGERFPGPITAEPRAGASAGRASRCGPVLHALVRMGRIAVPFLVSKTNIADAVVRGWATRLLGEIPSTEGAEAIARRFTDPEEDVRRAALAGARLLENNQPARSALREALARLASDRKERVSEREAVINALSALRDPLSVPALISLLQDASPVIGEGALAALVVLTRQDFGAHPNAWLSWWEKNRQRHRIEWLIDTLTHENPDLRRAAGDELKGATKEYFGYYDDLPRKERVRAQQRYREWWQTRGHILFS
jgi:HEAT repeat protein